MIAAHSARAAAPGPAVRSGGNLSSADGAFLADRAPRVAPASSWQHGLAGACFSGHDVLNGECSGSDPATVTPSSVAGSTTKIAEGNGTEAPCDPGTPSDAEASTEAPVPSAPSRTSDGSFSIGSDVWPGTSKLIEEMGELTQVLGKLIALHGAAAHWDGTDLVDRLHEEVADVQAALHFFVGLNGLDGRRLNARFREKVRLFNQWQEDQ